MSTFILNIAVLSIPSLLLGVMRHKWWWTWVLIIATIFAGLMQQVLILSDVWMLPIATGLMDDAWLLMIWLLWSVTLSSAVTIRSVSLKTSALMGACLGHLATPLLLKQSEIDNKVEHTTACWLGSMALPASMIGAAQLWNGGFWWGLFWVPALLGLWRLGALQGEHSSIKGSIDRPWVLMLAGFTMLLTSWCSEWGHWLMAAEIPVWIGMSVIGKHKLDWQSISNCIGVFYLVNIAVAAGLAESAGWGLEEMPMDLHAYLPVGVLAGSAVATMLVGIVPMTVFGMALLVRTMDLASVGVSLETVQLVYVLGLVVGNWNPWVSAQTWLQQWGTRIAVSIGSLSLISAMFILFT